MNRPISFPPQDLAQAAAASYRYGFVERAYDEARTPEAARDLLDAWGVLKELQEKLDFYFHGRPNEEPTLVLMARRAFFRNLRGELGL